MHSDMMTEIGPTEEKEKVTTPAPDSMLGAPAKNFIFGNALYHNLGNGKFEEVSNKVGLNSFGLGASALPTSTRTGGRTFSLPRE